MFAIRYFLLATTIFSIAAFGGNKSSAQKPVPTIPTVERSAATPEDGPGKMHLDVTVTTEKGKPAEPLPEQAFTLLDDKVPRPITSFQVMSGTDAPVEVVIVVDSVNTPYIHLSYQRDQIAKYLRANEGVLPYPTTFAVLTDTSFNIYGKTSKNGNELAQALDNTDIGLRVINRSQGFYGASDQTTISVNALSQLVQQEAKMPGRKLILWVSPGWPLLSGPGVELDNKQEQGIFQSVVNFSTEMRKGNITLYNINSWGADESVGRAFYYRAFLDGVKQPRNAQLGNLAVQVLAEQSGGLALNSSDVVGMIGQCVADVDHYYRLTFQSGPADKPDQYHDLRVKLAVQGLVARTREGYYSQP